MNPLHEPLISISAIELIFGALTFALLICAAVTIDMIFYLHRSRKESQARAASPHLDASGVASERAIQNSLRNTMWFGVFAGVCVLGGLAYISAVFIWVV